MQTGVQEEGLDRYVNLEIFYRNHSSKCSLFGAIKINFSVSLENCENNISKLDPVRSAKSKVYVEYLSIH